METQRLAVGTHEGAVVMYDLKTAIRLYVLEGHTKPITTCSFSADGRRLVTISLGESLVLVWKVGSSFASFFNPGAPPSQGHVGSQPFKTLKFNVGADGKLVSKKKGKAISQFGVSSGKMTTAETLDLVRIEWITDRSVKVRIRQSVLTFST
jgi:WD40 repeat protein